MANTNYIPARLTSSTERPEHTIAFSKKKSKANGDPSDWGANAVAYYGSQSSIDSSMRTEMNVLYKLAHGYIDESDYSYVLNPYGEEQRKRESLQGDPARLRNYDIISPAISRVVGDFLVRDTSFQVVATNSDVERRRQDTIKSSLKESLMQQFRNELAAQGLDTGFTDPAQQEQQIGQQVNQILAQSENIPDTMTMKGQEALDYITYYNELERKYRMGLNDYLTVGRVFSYRDVFRNDTVFEIVNPLDFDYLANPNEEFIEDGESARLDMYLTVGETIDKFREDLTDDEISWLEQAYGDTGSHYSGADNAQTDIDLDWRQRDANILWSNTFGVRRQNMRSGVLVKHVVFRSKKEIGSLHTFGLDGAEEIVTVDRDFKPRKGEEVDWVWVDEIWEGYMIADTLFKRVQPLPLQVGTANDPSACKLPYNGRIYGTRVGIPNTPVKKGKSHQELYNILKYRLERTIAKNKDKFTIIPLGLVPESDDMDMFSMMYYADYHGYMFVDESDPKALQAINALKAIDVSMREYIKFLHDICSAIRMEYLELVGIPRQKLADIKASDDVGNTRAALNEGSLILEEMFVSYEEFIEKDYQVMLDNSKLAWIDGRKAQFLNAEKELTMLDVDPFLHASTDFSIFVKGNKAERENLNNLKAMSQAFAQNSATPTMVGRILKGKNFDTLMRELEKMENDMNQRQDSAAQAEQANAQAEREMEQQKIQKDYYKIDEDNKRARDVAIINSEGSITTSLLSAGEATDGAISRANQSLDDLNMEKEKSNLAYADIQQKREKSANDVMIAKENKNKFDVQSK